MTMPFRWQFLSSLFDTSNDLNDIDIPSLHTGLDLTELYLNFLDFILNPVAKKEYIKKQQANPVVKKSKQILMKRLNRSLVL